MSHAGCYATIAALMAKKMQLQLQGCEVRSEAVKDPSVGKITEEVFDILFKLDGPKEKIQASRSNVEARALPVGILFEKAGVKIAYKLRTQKE